MTPHKLENILDDIASEEIADDMNLWPDIHDRLKTIPAPRPRRLLGLSRAAAVLAVILFAGTVYAVYQTVWRNGDPGIQAVSELITEIDQSLLWAPDDVNVTLDWGYADGHRIVIGWTVDFPVTLDVQSPTVTLMDRNGTPFESAAFLYGGGGGGGGGGDRVAMALTNSFDATGITGAPETLPFTVHFTFGELPEGEATGSGGGGSGGGGGNSAGTPKTPIGQPFRLMFDFEVPFIPAEPVDGEFTAEANGITLTVRDLSYAPSVTLGTLCYEIPADGEIYRPVFALPEGDPVEFVTFYGDPALIDPDAESFCGDLGILAPANPDTGALNFTVKWLQTYDDEITPETVSQLKTLVEEAGLGFEVSYSEPQEEGRPGSYRAEWLAGRDQSDEHAAQYEQLTRFVAETFHGLIDGPWSFEIDVR